MFFSVRRICRISFAFCGALVTQLALSSAACAAEPAKASPNCKVAVQLYSFRHDLDRDLPGTLDRIKKLGIDCVEAFSLHGRTPEQLRSEFDRAHLRVISFHLPEEMRNGAPEQAVKAAK